MDDIQCPYNALHRLAGHRMPYHMIKCKKNYRGPPLDTCPFNAMHMVPQGTLQEHFLKCDDYFNANRERLSKKINNY